MTPPPPHPPITHDAPHVAVVASLLTREDALDIALGLYAGLQRSMVPESGAALVELILTSSNIAASARNILCSEREDTAASLLKWLIEYRYGPGPGRRQQTPRRQRTSRPDHDADKQGHQSHSSAPDGSTEA